ncbi:MAG: aminodeoxychorismate/anthranilate synthase component II [Candidatus Hydrogenedentes bacterium]|nr:aminodeoxychorismate/anthranilate synthase component II [Candidatus Hydrogenedentota bacterium]
MIVVIDNYDSFTYNLVQSFYEFEKDIRVFRNDEITAAELETLKPDRLVISPGPGIPEEAGNSLEIIRALGKQIPVLGVCLGNLAVGAAYGASILRADVIMHGKTSEIYHKGDPLFKNIPSSFVATRYHSLVVDPQHNAACLQVTAQTKEGVIMGLAHKEYPIWSVQFHPESILTPQGEQIIENFMRL